VCDSSTFTSFVALPIQMGRPLARVPEADVVALAHIWAGPLEGVIFFAPEQIEVAHWSRGVGAAQHRIDADARRGHQVDLIGAIPARCGEAGAELAIRADDLHVEGVAHMALAIECRQRAPIGRGVDGLRRRRYLASTAPGVMQPSRDAEHVCHGHPNDDHRSGDDPHDDKHV
jgi:hypothetical protein